MLIIVGLNWDLRSNVGRNFTEVLRLTDKPLFLFTEELSLLIILLLDLVVGLVLESDSKLVVDERNNHIVMNWDQIRGLMEVHLVVGLKEDVGSV